MIRPTHVLAVTDFSDASDEALRQAHGYARLHGARLSVLHVVPDFVRANPLFPDGSADDLDTELSLEEKALDDVTARVNDVLGALNENVDIGVRIGPVDSSVMHYAEDKKVDVVVTGATGRTGLARLLLGSTAERIVRYAHCSVLVVRATVPTGRVLVASDLSSASLVAVEQAKLEAQARGARLELLHALDLAPLGWTAAAGPFGGLAVPGLPERAAELRRLAQESLRGLGGPDAGVHVIEGPAKRAIVSLAESLPADLVVVATHGRTGLARMALGSVAEAVVKAAPCSVLVVRSPAPKPEPLGNFET